MSLVHRSPSSLTGDDVRRFLDRIDAENAGLFAGLDKAAYAERLAERAEGLFATDDATGAWQGAVFGYCNDARDRRAYISFLGRVADAGAGTGRWLHDAFCALARERGMESVRLETLKRNIRAVRFYRALGYASVEDRGDRELLELRIV